MRRIPPVLLVVLALSTTGCAQTFDATHLGVPASLASSAGAPAEGTHFVVTRRAVFALWGLFKVSEPSLQKTLATQLVGGKAVTDVRIKVRSKLGDLLITGLTLGLVVPRAVTIEGTIVDQ